MQPDRQPTGTTGGPKTILMVDDEGSVREMLCAFLRHQGYAVLEAGDGSEALAICARHGGRIDLIVTDVMMPQMRGTELAERLLSSRPQTKVIFISGYIRGHDLMDPRVTFLRKPFQIEDLAQKIHQLLD